MTIRNRIFAVVGVVIAAAFLQTLIVLQVEGRRAATAASLDRSIWRLENQADLGRLIVELDAAERAVEPAGPPAAAAERDRLWGMYERAAALLPEYLDSPESTRELAAIDALMRDWRRTPPGADRAALMGRIRAGFDRFDTRERNRLADERIKANSQSLQSTLLTLGIPAVAIVMLLLLVAFVARILLDPLKAIATSAQTISGGNFDVSLPRESRDEIGDLVRAFREMITAVQRREREVTEARIKAEREHQRLQATIETVPVALVIVDAETGRIALQNRTAGALIGEEPDGAAREAYWRAFGVTTRDGTPVDVRVWGAERVLRGQTIVGEELVVKHPDGREIPILVSAAPLREDNGRISGGVAAFQDITSLYEVDRLKSEFVSIVSHELRTPLTSIKGALQLLIDERRASDPDDAMLLNVALSNTERLVRIINDILDISKIEAGKLELNARPHAVDEVVRAVAPERGAHRPRRPRHASGRHRARRAGRARRSRSRHPGGREPALERAEGGAAAVRGDALRPARRRRLRGLLRHGSRQGHRARQDRPAVPEVPATGRRQHPQGPRHRPWPRHRQGARGNAGGAGVGGKHRRSRIDVHRDGAGGGDVGARG